MVAQLTAKAVVGAFNSLKSASGKPIVRLNGVKEWTVLAGIVCLIPSGTSYEAIPILLATGVKALPDLVREYSNGRVVHDMHAEVLSLRLFNWFLLDECERLSIGKELRIIEKINSHHENENSLYDLASQMKDDNKNCERVRNLSGTQQTVSKNSQLKRDRDVKKINSSELQNLPLPHLSHSSLTAKDDGLANDHSHLPAGFRLRPGIKLALYISEPPCGDASMSYVSKGADPWAERAAKLNDNEHLIVRGREQFDRVGVVRTKPGRVDSVLTLSKSCSDKLCVKQVTGITNLVTAPLFPEGVFLSYTVLRRDKIDIADFERCFYTRFCNKLDDSVEKVPLQLALYDSDDYPFHKPLNEAGGDQQHAPALLSLLYIVPRDKVEVINNGVRLGAFRKNRPPNPGGESFICNYQLIHKLKRIQPNSQYKSYLELKKSQSKRQNLKSLARLVLGGWVQTMPDEFCITSDNIQCR